METGQTFAESITGLTPQEDGNGGITTQETTTAPNQATTDTTVQTTQAPENQQQNDDAEVTVIDQLRNTYGIIEEDFTNDIEGIQKLVDTLSPKQAQKILDEKFTKYPVMKELEAHLESGKPLESFFQVKQVESSKLPIYKLTGDEKKDGETKAYYKDVMKANCAELGLSETQTKRMIEASDLEGTLFEDYQDAVGQWNNRRDKESAAIKQQQEAKQQDEQAKEKDTLEKINTLIDAGTIGNAIIPIAERPDFKKFQLEQDKDGLTARDKALAELPLENYLFIDYLLFKKFNVKGLTLAPNKVQQMADLNNKRKGTIPEGSEGNAADDSRLPLAIRNMDFTSLRQ